MTQSVISKMPKKQGKAVPNLSLRNLESLGNKKADILDQGLEPEMLKGVEMSQLNLFKEANKDNIE